MTLQAGNQQIIRSNLKTFSKRKIGKLKNEDWEDWGKNLKDNFAMNLLSLIATIGKVDSCQCKKLLHVKKNLEREEEKPNVNPIR